MLIQNKHTQTRSPQPPLRGAIAIAFVVDRATWNTCTFCAASWECILYWIIHINTHSILYRSSMFLYSMRQFVHVLETRAFAICRAIVRQFRWYIVYSCEIGPRQHPTHKLNWSSRPRRHLAEERANKQTNQRTHAQTTKTNTTISRRKRIYWISRRRRRRRRRQWTWRCPNWAATWSCPRNRVSRWIAFRKRWVVLGERCWCEMEKWGKRLRAWLIVGSRNSRATPEIIILWIEYNSQTFRNS